MRFQVGVKGEWGEMHAWERCACQSEKRGTVANCTQGSGPRDAQLLFALTADRSVVSGLPG